MQREIENAIYTYGTPGDFINEDLEEYEAFQNVKMEGEVTQYGSPRKQGGLVSNSGGY